MSEAGGSARDDYDGRRRWDRLRRRQSMPWTVPVVVAAAVAVYLLVRLVADGVNRLTQHLGTHGSSVVSGHEANEAAIVLAVVVAIGAATAAWGRNADTTAWKRGAEGEEALGLRLRQLVPDGFRVLHDRRVPRSRANIDHLVIGPTGVYVVDAKNYSGRVTLSKGTLWRGRSAMTKKLATTQWEAQQVRLAIAGHLPPGCPVRAVMCVLGAEMPRVTMDVSGVRVVSGGRQLLRELRGGGTVLDAGDVVRLEEAARAALVPARQAPGSAHERAAVPADDRRPDEHGHVGPHT